MPNWFNVRLAQLLNRWISYLVSGLLASAGGAMNDETSKAVAYIGSGLVIVIGQVLDLLLHKVGEKYWKQGMDYLTAHLPTSTQNAIKASPTAPVRVQQALNATK